MLLSIFSLLAIAALGSSNRRPHLRKLRKIKDAISTAKEKLVDVAEAAFFDQIILKPMFPLNAKGEWAFPSERIGEAAEADPVDAAGNALTATGADVEFAGPGRRRLQRKPTLKPTRGKTREEWAKNQVVDGYTRNIKKCAFGGQLDKTTGSTPAECGKLCDKEAKCVGFAFGRNYGSTNARAAKPRDCVLVSNEMAKFCDGSKWNTDYYAKATKETCKNVEDPRKFMDANPDIRAVRMKMNGCNGNDEQEVETFFLGACVCIDENTSAMTHCGKESAPIVVAIYPNRKCQGTPSSTAWLINDTCIPAWNVKFEIDNPSDVYKTCMASDIPKVPQCKAPGCKLLNEVQNSDKDDDKCTGGPADCAQVMLQCGCKTQFVGGDCSPRGMTGQAKTKLMQCQQAVLAQGLAKDNCCRNFEEDVRDNQNPNAGMVTISYYDSCGSFDARAQPQDRTAEMMMMNGDCQRNPFAGGDEYVKMECVKNDHNKFRVSLFADNECTKLNDIMTFENNRCELDAGDGMVVSWKEEFGRGVCATEMLVTLRVDEYKSTACDGNPVQTSSQDLRGRENLCQENPFQEGSYLTFACEKGKPYSAVVSFFSESDCKLDSRMIETIFETGQCNNALGTPQRLTWDKTQHESICGSQAPAPATQTFEKWAGYSVRFNGVKEGACAKWLFYKKSVDECKRKCAICGDTCRGFVDDKEAKNCKFKGEGWTDMTFENKNKDTDYYEKVDKDCSLRKNWDETFNGKECGNADDCGGCYNMCQRNKCVRTNEKGEVWSKERCFNLEKEILQPVEENCDDVLTMLEDENIRKCPPEDEELQLGCRPRKGLDDNRSCFESFSVFLQQWNEGGCDEILGIDLSDAECDDNEVEDPCGHCRTQCVSDEDCCEKHQNVCSKNGWCLYEGESNEDVQDCDVRESGLEENMDLVFWENNGICSKNAKGEFCWSSLNPVFQMSRHFDDAVDCSLLGNLGKKDDCCWNEVLGYTQACSSPQGISAFQWIGETCNIGKFYDDKKNMCSGEKLDKFMCDKVMDKCGANDPCPLGTYCNYKNTSSGQCRSCGDLNGIEACFSMQGRAKFDCMHRCHDFFDTDDIDIFPGESIPVNMNWVVYNSLSECEADEDGSGGIWSEEEDDTIGCKNDLVENSSELKTCDEPGTVSLTTFLDTGCEGKAIDNFSFVHGKCNPLDEDDYEEEEDKEWARNAFWKVMWEGGCMPEETNDWMNSGCVKATTKNMCNKRASCQWNNEIAKYGICMDARGDGCRVDDYVSEYMEGEKNGATFDCKTEVAHMERCEWACQPGWKHDGKPKSTSMFCINGAWEVGVAPNCMKSDQCGEWGKPKGKGKKMKKISSECDCLKICMDMKKYTGWMFEEKRARCTCLTDLKTNKNGYRITDSNNVMYGIL